jgi:hypothetical protein
MSIGAFAQPPGTPAQPGQIEAQYRVTNSGIEIGSVKETFVRKGDKYSIQSVTRSEGLLKALLDDQITVESSGRVGAEGLQPLVYVEHRLKDPKRDLTATFDWDKGVMRTVLHGEHAETALPPGTQDRISVMYQFVMMRRFPETLTLPIAERRKVEVHTYRLVGDEWTRPWANSTRGTISGSSGKRPIRAPMSGSPRIASTSRCGRYSTIPRGFASSRPS